MVAEVVVHHPIVEAVQGRVRAPAPAPVDLHIQEEVVLPVQEEVLPALIRVQEVPIDDKII